MAAAVAAAVLAAPLTAANETWLRAQTPHLTIVSSANERATREVAQRLERFVDALASLTSLDVQPDVPVTVMLFRDEKAFAPFRPKQNGRTLNLAGYFRRGDDQNLIALHLGGSGEKHSDRVVFHEYAHALTSRAAALWPLWLQEGLAEFSSTFQADGRRVEFGDPVRDHLRLLRTERWLPLRTVLAVDRSSPLYNEDAQNIYYAQAWALVHYLMVGDHGRHRGGLAQFMGRLSAGLAPGLAFAESFGGGGETALEYDLRRYITADRYLDEDMTFDRPVPLVALSLRVLTSAEADIFQGNLLMRVGRRDEAAPYLARARVADPKTPGLEESLGFLALLEGRADDALTHFRLAIAQDPANHLAHYYAAEALRRPLANQGRPLPPGVAREMMAPLGAAIALAPSFARGYYLLGLAHYAAGEDLDEGVRVLRIAMRLAPPYRAAMLMLASIQLKQRDFTAAMATAQAIIDAPDANDRVKAEARLVANQASALLR